MAWRVAFLTVILVKMKAAQAGEMDVSPTPWTKMPQAVLLAIMLLGRSLLTGQ